MKNCVSSCSPWEMLSSYIRPGYVEAEAGILQNSPLEGLSWTELVVVEEAEGTAVNAALCPRAPPRGPDAVNNSESQNEMDGTSATQSHCERQPVARRKREFPWQEGFCFQDP